MLTKNTLKKFASDNLTKTLFDDMYQKIMDEKKISYAMRQRDFSGKYEMPAMRKAIYLDLILKYVNHARLTDLFPEESITA